MDDGRERGFACLCTSGDARGRARPSSLFVRLDGEDLTGLRYAKEEDMTNLRAPGREGFLVSDKFRAYNCTCVRRAVNDDSNVRVRGGTEC